MRQTIKSLALWTGILLTAMALIGCATPRQGNNPASQDDFRIQVAQEERLTEINESLMMMAVSGDAGGQYRVGPEDRLRVDVLGVEELSREYRINGAGSLLMPLVGGIPVAGLTLEEVERAIEDALGAEYLRNPQVSVEVTEFRSQQFTVVGAVSNPRVYNTSRQVTLIEALAMAGGIDANAGNVIFLNDRVPDPETGQPSTRTLIIDIEELMNSAEQFNVVLGEGAMINVPRGGFFYVEGAVNRPGAYPQRGDSTVLKALAQAGGLSFEAQRSSLRVLQRNTAGHWEAKEVNYSAIRDDPSQDIPLRSGDIVVVESGAIRVAWSNFFRVATPLALLGFRPL